MHHAETGNGARIADVVLARLCRDGQGALEKPLGFVELVLLEMQEREGAQDVASVVCSGPTTLTATSKARSRDALASAKRLCSW